MNKKIGIMIIVFAIILITLGVFFKIEQETGLMFGIDPEDVKLNEQGQPVLPFCDDKDECIKDLKSGGMPDNFLENNNIDIECNNGVCVVI